MRLGRLVAAGLVVGAFAGFVGALLRPRTVHTYGIDTGHAAGAGVDPFDMPDVVEARDERVEPVVPTSDATMPDVAAPDLAGPDRAGPDVAEPQDAAPTTGPARRLDVDGPRVAAGARGTIG
jgi:hypothetical protein